MEVERGPLSSLGSGRGWDATPQWLWTEGEGMVVVRGVLRGPWEANTGDAFPFLHFLFLFCFVCLFIICFGGILSSISVSDSIQLPHNTRCGDMAASLLLRSCSIL